MVNSILSFAALAALATSALAAPRPQWGQWGQWGQYGQGWTEQNCPGKYQACTPENIRTRVDFETMSQYDRKAYTDAIKCIMAQPSNLNNTQYPAAINKYFDYAVVHVNRTQYVHLDGFFLTWHRYFLWLFENDLRDTCGYRGPFPYWNFAASSGNIAGSAIFNGDQYSMSGNGLPNNTGPIVLGPGLTIPHGSGGGCVVTGPFANMTTTMANIDPSVLITGAGLPPTAFDYQPNCLIRDLNEFVAMTWTNQTEVDLAVHSQNASIFDFNLNGIIGGSSLGIHSAAHFSIGGPMDSIHVSPQDPIWWSLHAMIDHVYTSWQIQNPSIAATLTGTGTALNTPPSPNVTLQSIEPDWGYFQEEPIMVGELISTTAGPFCYQYDTLLG